MPIDRWELDEVISAFNDLKEAYHNVKEFLRMNKDDLPVSFEYLKAYNFGHIEPHLFEEHDYVGNDRSIESVLNDLDGSVKEEDDEEEEKEEDDE